MGDMVALVGPVPVTRFFRDIIRVLCEDCQSWGVLWGVGQKGHGRVRWAYSGVAWVILMCSTVTVARSRIIFTMVSMLALGEVAQQTGHKRVRSEKENRGNKGISRKAIQKK